MRSDWAVDGASALAQTRTQKYDLVLTDLILPDANGGDLARQILAEVPDPKPPIIAVTAYSTQEKMEEAKAAGIMAFVTKPVSRRKLEMAILSLGEHLHVRAGREIEVAQTGIDCDFAPILRLADGTRILSEYAATLPAAWSGVVAKLDQDPEEAARGVHAFRSRILAVQAAALSEQLALLEEAVRSAQHSDVRRLVDLAGVMVAEVAAAAQARVLAGMK